MNTQAPPSVESMIALMGQETASIPEIFRARARRSPEKTFLIWEGVRWTYQQALAEIERHCGFFNAHGIGPGYRVASYLSNSPAAVWCWLGTVFVGGIYVPLNRHHKTDVLRDMLSRSGARLLVTEASAAIELNCLDVSGIETVLFVDEEIGPGLRASVTVLGPSAIETATPLCGVIPAPGDVACIMFTSGTTGRSKAVVVPHNQYCRGAARLVDAFGLLESDVFHHWLPLFHLGGQLHMTMCAVVCGGSVALFKTFSRTRFWTEVKDVGATVICGFASILHFLWSEDELSDDTKNSLRVGIIANIPKHLHEPFERRFGMTLAENYGMTEADPVTLPRVGVKTPRGSAGLAAPDFEIAIFDEHDNSLGPLKTGEIVIRPRASNVMTLGYEGDELATIQAFRNLWFHTGDIGYLDESGFLYFSDRTSNTIRRRGENISSAEVESILMKMEGVEECVALAVPSDVGEDEVKVALTLKEGFEIAPADIHRFALANMARFMAPRFIEIRASLPKTDLGKVAKPELKQNSDATWDANAAAY